MVKLRKAVQVKFKQQESYKARNPKEANLVKAFAKLTTEKQVAAFLRDLMTMSEIEEIANRLEMAKLLSIGHSYQEVSNKMKVSTTTVTRTAHWLFHGCGGYQLVLKKRSRTI